MFVRSSRLRRNIELPSGRILEFSKSPLLMGIVNVTPDSFYEESAVPHPEDALRRVEKMVRAGCDIVDVGGESTRPGALPVPLEEELKRVVPVIEEIKRNFDIPVSVDTYKSIVAQRALRAGAEMVNDISGLRFDEEMVEVVKKGKVPVVVMHIKGTPRDMQKDPRYEDVVAEITEYFRDRVGFLRSQGIEDHLIILDPGIGFGKNFDHNITIIRNIERFVEMGYPLLVGHSRKSFIGHILGGAPASRRLEGTLALSVYFALKGVAVLRVHDVEAHRRALKTVETIHER